MGTENDNDAGSLGLGDILRGNLRKINMGGVQLVLLRPLHSVGIEVAYEFALDAINDVERLYFRKQIGDKVSALEKIGMMLLLESAYIDYGGVADGLIFDSLSSCKDEQTLNGDDGTC